ncbi:serine/threonine-protein kinase [Rubritalea tangerina]|uniref:Serine/threonine-protein kinase n=1 Tax=Rubritalea tangerina TaxID=430798 RepID=A0ABW4ZDD9_9BACT
MGDRYRIEQELGTGRAGAVYEAYDTELNRPVAFRRFDTVEENLEDEAWRGRFFDVVSDLSRISHANILSVLDAGIDESGPYLVTAHVEGLRLSQVMKHAGQMDLVELYSLTTQCLDALQAAEEYGYYHHALCPSSIIATPKASGGFHYILMDLGHSKLIPLVGEEGMQTLSKTLDPALMAPEIFEGQPEGIRSTLYMFGQLIYWVAAGGHPLAGISLELAHAKHKAGEIPFLRSYRADLPEAFRQWIYWLIQPDPAKRPKSVMEAIRKLPSYEDATTAPSLPQPMRMDAQGMSPSYQDEA